MGIQRDCCSPRMTAKRSPLPILKQFNAASWIVAETHPFRWRLKDHCVLQKSKLLSPSHDYGSTIFQSQGCLLPVLRSHHYPVPPAHQLCSEDPPDFCRLCFFLWPTANTRTVWRGQRSLCTVRWWVWTLVSAHFTVRAQVWGILAPRGGRCSLFLTMRFFNDAMFSNS